MDKVIVLSDNGNVDAQGNYSDIIETCEFLQRLAAPKERTENLREEATPVSEQETARPSTTIAGPAPAAARSRSSGALSLYGYYIDSIGRFSFLCILGFAVVYVVCLVFPQILLSWWYSSVPEKGVTYLVTYTIVSIASVVAIGLYIG